MAADDNLSPRGCDPHPDNSDNTITDFSRWRNPASLDPAWDARAARAASLIPQGARVLDLGCGAMTIERHLPPSCSYLPCDLIARDERTIICDFNSGEFPDAAASCDRIVMLGLLEYIGDLSAFATRLATTRKTLIASYCPTDFGVVADRRAVGWLNHLTLDELTGIFAEQGLRARLIERIDSVQVLLVLEPASPMAQERNVVVLSCAGSGNFGDRLGFHLLNSVLPPNAISWHAYLDQLPEISGKIDLLIIGIGNSLYAPLLTDRLLDLLSRARCAIGIFGTQYRGEIPRERIERLVGQLDMWFARYEEDLLLYGSHKPTEIHLGDWLIDAFPMVEASDPATLTIGNEIWNELPLDRVIQRIQRFQSVHSTRLHPLLCALTSAKSVSFAEQRETGGDVSGKFDSLLLDVFGRRYPEGVFWSVDRHAVVKYKRKVRGNIERLRQEISRLLG